MGYWEPLAGIWQPSTWDMSCIYCSRFLVPENTAWYLSCPVTREWQNWGEWGASSADWVRLIPEGRKWAYPQWWIVAHTSWILPGRALGGTGSWALLKALNPQCTVAVPHALCNLNASEWGVCLCSCVSPHSIPSVQWPWAAGWGQHGLDLCCWPGSCHWPLGSFAG